MAQDPLITGIILECVQEVFIKPEKIKMVNAVRAEWKPVQQVGEQPILHLVIKKLQDAAKANQALELTPAQTSILFRHLIDLGIAEILRSNKISQYDLDRAREALLAVQPS
jgi:hypothetical protein